MEYMTVQNLIDKLSKMPRDIPIILSSDDEGNSYRFLESIDVIEISGYNLIDGELEIGILHLTPSLEKLGFTEEDLKDNPCIILG